MNLTLDPAFIAGNTENNSAIRKLKAVDEQKSASFKTELESKIAENENKNSTEKPRDKKLWDTCVDFESIFVGQLFDEMRKTVHKGGILHGGHAEEIFEDFLYDEYAKITSKNSNIGIAKMLYDQLS